MSSIMPESHGPPQDPVVVFQRAKHAARVAEELFRADVLDERARLGDAAPMEQAMYRQIAEAAVQMAADRDLQEASLYFASSAFLRETEGPSFELMPLSRRHHLVETMRVVIRRYLAFLRGDHPDDLPHFSNLSRMDKQEIRARQHARVLSIDRSPSNVRTTFAVLGQEGL